MVEDGRVGRHEHLLLLPDESVVLLAGNARKKHPSVRRRVEGVLLLWLTHDNGGARVGKTRNDAKEHRLLDGLREVERHAHHVVSLLLGGRLEYGDHGKLAVETRVLLVLRGVHGRVVGSKHHQSALNARDGAVDEGIGAHVHAHVLHAHQGTLAGIGHAEGSLHGGLFVCTPARTDATLLCKAVALDEFRNLRRRSARVGINTAQTRVYRTQSNRFVTEKKFLFHV